MTTDFIEIAWVQRLIIVATLLSSFTALGICGFCAAWRTRRSLKELNIYQLSFYYADTSITVRRLVLRELCSKVDLCIAEMIAKAELKSQSKTQRRR